MGWRGLCCRALVPTFFDTWLGEVFVVAPFVWRPRGADVSDSSSNGSEHCWLQAATEVHLEYGQPPEAQGAASN
jgi:hypothetical protein